MDAYGRRSIRLRGYDYALPGAYFVTICTARRIPLFGEVARGRMNLTFLGEIASACWRAIPVHFANVTLDAWVVMPDHVHGIIAIRSGGEALGSPPEPKEQVLLPKASPPRTPPRGTAPGSAAAIIQNYKSLSARRINRWRGTPGARVWQRNYYEHVVRDDEGLERIRAYIRDNPLAWGDAHEPS